MQLPLPTGTHVLCLSPSVFVYPFRIVGKSSH